MNRIFTAKIKGIISLTALVAAIVIGFITEFAYSSNAVMVIFMAIAAISVSDIIVSKIYKTDISYPLFLAGNIVGLIGALFVVSKASAMSDLYLILFLVIIFAALWIYEICLISIDDIKKRIIAAFVSNLCVVLLTAAAIVLVITISVFATLS